MRTGAPTLSLVTVAQMKRTGKPETVSLTVNGPTRTNGQQTKPTPRAGSGAGATGRTKHMQEQKNNTKPKFTTNVYVHRTKLHVLKARTRCLLGSGGNNRAQGICVLPIRFLVRLVIRHGLVAAVVAFVTHECSISPCLRCAASALAPTRSNKSPVLA